MFLLPWLMLPALGWTGDETERFALTQPARALVAGTWEGGPVLVVTGPTGTQVFTPEGELRAEASLTGEALLLRDLDGDLRTELLVCGPTGVHILRAQGEPMRLDTTPCDQLRAFDAGGFDALVIVSDHQVFTLTPEAGGFSKEALEIELSGAPLLATDGEEIAIAPAQAQRLFLFGPTSDATLRTSGPLIGLAGGGGLAWLVGGEAPSLFDEGDQHGLSATGSHLVSLDLEGSGHQRAWTQEGEVVVFEHDSFDLPASLLAGADLDGDQCGELVVVSEEELVVFEGSCDELLLAPLSPHTDVEEEPEQEDEEEEAEVYPPKEWTQGPRVAPSDLPYPAEELPLDTLWTDLHLFVGQRVTVQATDARGERKSFRSLGGPPGFNVQRQGLIEFTPVEEDIGLWRVSVRMSHGGPVRWAGFRLHIWPRPAPGEPLPEMPVVHPTERGPRVRVRDTPTWLTLGRCYGGLGAASGVARAGGLTWENLGDPDYEVLWSPAAALTCGGGGEGLVQWVIGVDTAPWFRYTELPVDRSHLLVGIVGVQLGNDTMRVGPYAGGGLNSTALGVRGLLTTKSAKRPTGPELRAAWLAPSEGVEVMALWMVAL